MIEIWILQYICCLNKKKSEKEEGLFDNDYFYILLSYFCSPTYLAKYRANPLHFSGALPFVT